LPYIEAKRKAHGRPNIFDEFKGQVTDDAYNLLDNHNIIVVKVPPNCMDCLQPTDLSINKSVKDYLRDKFQKWYPSEVEKSYHQDESTTPIDLRMSIMKPLGAGWLVGAYNYVKEKDSLVKNGYKSAGISDILNKVV